MVRQAQGGMNPEPPLRGHVCGRDRKAALKVEVSPLRWPGLLLDHVQAAGRRPAGIPRFRSVPGSGWLHNAVCRTITCGQRADLVRVQGGCLVRQRRLLDLADRTHVHVRPRREQRDQALVGCPAGLVARVGCMTYALFERSTQSALATGSL